MRKIILKLTTLLLLIGLNWAGLSAIGETFAYFNDIEQGAANFTAGTLDFSLSGGGSFLPTLIADSEATSTVFLANAGTADFNYQAVTASSTGALCQYLEVKDDISGIYQPLSSFVSATTTFLLDADIIFSARLATTTDPAVENQSCNFDLVFSGWQINLPDNTSGFTDTEIIAMSISSGEWPSQEPPIPGPGDVVINEIMWMGSKEDDDTLKPHDEWIELRNMTSHDIDISNWDIDGAVSGSGGHLEIPTSNIILAGGYFLIANYNRVDSLVNVDVDLTSVNINFDNEYDDNGALILKDIDGNIIDQTPAVINSNWPAGSNGVIKKSMERNIVPSDGMATSSWHTCEPLIMSSSDLSLMLSYWDSNAQDYNCGTPKNPNLSKNDPTAQDYDPNYVAESENIIEEPAEEIVSAEPAETTTVEEAQPADNENLSDENSVENPDNIASENPDLSSAENLGENTEQEEEPAIEPPAENLGENSDEPLNTNEPTIEPEEVVLPDEIIAPAPEPEPEPELAIKPTPEPEPTPAPEPVPGPDPVPPAPAEAPTV
ncbi:MAG: lamin tail domain-containing protein [Patescibacteria group bacterium]